MGLSHFVSKQRTAAAITTMAAGGCSALQEVEQEEEEEEEEVDEEDHFFDSREDLSSVSDSCLDDYFVSRVPKDHRFDVWVISPVSVRERRDKFLRSMGLNACQEMADQDEEALSVDEIASEIDQIVLDESAVLRSSDLDNLPSSMSSWSGESTSPGTSDLSEDSVLDENFRCHIKNLDNGSVPVLDAFGKDSDLRSLHEVRSSKMMRLDEFNRNFGSSSFVQQLMQWENRGASTNSSEMKLRKSRRMGWLRRLGVVACAVDGQVEEGNLNISDSDHSGSGRAQRVKVWPYRKKFKEFSAVYRGQDIRAHEGAILTMKFSPGGQYLASGGEDGVVCVWHVMECELTDEDDVLEDDPSCIYFTVNHNSKLAPMYAVKESKVKSRSMKRTSDSACVVIPQEVFRLSEKPVHVFHGHNGDVQDLSWSKDKYLLSSSMDKTVRLWKVGCNICLKIFSHNDYVTCVQFNPIDENYFISGSIDGKVRIWEISESRVVGWADIRDIVTAVCYRPDGKGLVAGSMTGDCRFYDASGNHLQLDVQISLQGKKKSPFKRITGLQFCPTDYRKLMVASADSQVRILDGVDVISKYKGPRNSGNQISASFTSDGRHIISASEDSNVYVWTYVNQDGPTSHQAKSTWSCERFLSSNASVAMSWHGFESKCHAPVTPEATLSQQDAFRDATGVQESDFLGNNSLFLSPAGSFTLSQGLFSEFLPKGSATWPEEKLPLSLAATPALFKSQFKFLKISCQNTTHAWGQVIVTGGWDGRIRSFQNYGLPVHL